MMRLAPNSTIVGMVARPRLSPRVAAAVKQLRASLSYAFVLLLILVSFAFAA
jgi:hypothetical protein